MPNLPDWLETSLVLVGLMILALLCSGAWLWYALNRKEITQWLDRRQVRFRPRQKAHKQQVSA